MFELITSIINLFRDLKPQRKFLPEATGESQASSLAATDPRDVVIVGLTMVVVVLALTIAIVVVQKSSV